MESLLTQTSSSFLSPKICLQDLEVAALKKVKVIATLHSSRLGMNTAWFVRGGALGLCVSLGYTLRLKAQCHVDGRQLQDKAGKPWDEANLVLIDIAY